MKRTIYLIFIILLSTNLIARTSLDTVPTTQNIGHMSTTWDEFKKASPSEQIPLILAPQASSTGENNLSFPIKIPQARQGHAPNLNMTYTNEGGSSWLGIGWNLSLSSFTLDTRWGVPTFDQEEESEIYLFDGKQMGPVFHRLEKFPRESERIFHLRKEGTFQKIIRHGSSTKNYWWEVREKDGQISYYGGSPTTGSNSAYQILNMQGHITEWLLVSTVDIYENLIKYDYQKVSYKSGIEVYPSSITYNGFQGNEGNYKIEFFLGGTVNGESRNDISLKCRTSMIRTLSSLLASISVSYKDETIRSYSFDYKTGAFQKTLLRSISEHDKEGALFYTYSFDYHNTVPVENGKMNLWGDKQEWNVPKDNVDVLAVSATNAVDFLEAPTLLGGAKSWNIGGNLAVTIGFVAGNPASKENTVGANGGGATSNGTGIISLVDINGDGLPDKVWKEDGNLFYRPNQQSFLTGVPDFGDKTQLTGISDFSKSNTISWNIGGELHLGLEPVSVMIGYSHEEATTKISTYFADYNGDDLLDIVHKKVVYFNSIGPDGHPRFTKNSGDTSSPIFKGDFVPPVIVDDEEQEQVESSFPLNDAVRVWIAPFSGSITISGAISLLESTDPAVLENENRDGVIAMIQMNDQELYRRVITSDDFAEYNPTGVNNLGVQEGDSIFFRVHSRYNGFGDEVAWDPEINYQNVDQDRMDVNDLPYFSYRASEDFLLSASSSYILTTDGTVQIEADFFKPQLTDSIFIQFQGGIEFDTVFGPSFIHDGLLTISDIPVSANTEYTVSVVSKSNVDWSSIDFRPIVSYTAFDNGTPATNSDGSFTNTTCTVPNFKAYTNIHQLGDPYIVPRDGRLIVKATINQATPISSLTNFTLKSKLYPDTLVSTSSPPAGLPNCLILELDAEEGDTLLADLNYIDSPFFLFNEIQIDQCEFILDGQISLVECGVYSQNLKTEISGHHYRGWGQFAYNANDGRGDSEIIVRELEIDEDGVAGDTSLIDDSSAPGDVEGTNVMLDDLFIVMGAEPKSKAWQGLDALTFIRPRTMASSRNGNQDVDLSSTGTIAAGEFPALDLKTKSISDALAGEVGFAGGGVTWSRSFSIVDIADMNGDRYPDRVFENSIQYSGPQGGLSGLATSHGWGSHYSESRAVGGGVNGSYISSSSKNSGASMGKGSNKKTSRKRAQGKAKMSGSRNAFKSSKSAIGFSGSMTFDRDSTKHTFMDINGDGLEDKLWSDGKVALNLGYEFAPAVNWGFKAIRGGFGKDIGGGVGFDYAGGSITAGISASRTDNQSDQGFMDINDDALIDRVISTKPIVVEINTGDGFSAPITLNENEDMDAGFSIGESTNLAGTVCIPVFLIRICFNPSTSIGQGTSSVGHAFSDIDGDGYVDVLSAHGDDAQLTVRSSNVGPTNMLKTVHMPMHGEMNFSYRPQGNTMDMPYSTWVLDSYTVNDGVEGDGENIYTYELRYNNPVHDRHERQFYGFETVEERQINDPNEKSRLIVRKYHVDNYYTQGLIKEESIQESDLNIYQSTNYNYSFRDVATGEILPSSFTNKDDGSVWTTLDQKRITISENTDQSLKRILDYEYDQYGNILSTLDEDEAGSSQKTVLSYRYDEDRYFHTPILTEQNYGNGELYRMSEFELDDKGNITQINEMLDDGSFVTTDLSYDVYGNNISFEKPENYKGERLTYERQYDGAEHQYLVYEKDSYGYEKSFAHEYFFNQMISSTDINGNTTEYTFDSKGRAATILSPYEKSNGLPYSIRFEYAPGAATAHAISYHYDPANQSDLDLIEFEDGLQRSIQTKVLAAISNNGSDTPMYIVSGTENYDLLGRKVKNYLPITESISSRSTLNKNTDDAFILRKYDVFNRIIEEVDPYGGINIYEYSLKENRDGKLALVTVFTDALGNKKDDYFNTRGRIISERFDGPEGDIWRDYEYDDFSQVLKIYDHFENETKYTYDMLGRRIRVKVPDAGATELVYDNAGNLIERVTATIKDVISEDGSIRYLYDHERLVQIDYPKHFQNKVQIHYGSPLDSFNRAGRIWLQEDATGGREYFFDVNGQPTKTIRTVMINRSNVYTYVSEAEYDSWERVSQFKYPDGETINYEYNIGGLLAKMTGKKNDKKMVYLDYAGYDKFSDRIYLNYGNNTIDTYSYDDKGRMAERTTKSATGNKLIEEIYTYDLADNLIQKENRSNGSEDLGGSFNETYTYDILHRLSKATGTWEDNLSNNQYDLDLEYDNLNNLTLKDQFVHINDELQLLSSHGFTYEYEHIDQPTRPSNVGGKDYEYDPNGNLLLSSSQSIFNYDQNVYDEENRLQGTSNNGYISRYTYDGFGVRTLKSHGESQGIFINGAPAGYIEHKLNFRVDLSPYFTVFENEYRKHYFIDDMRFLTKIGTGVFQTTIAQGPEITAGSIDYKSRIQQYEQSILDYYEGLEVSPGPPTLLALLGQPEINDFALPDASNSNPYNTPPINWPNIAPPDTSGPPGVPVFYETANIDNTTVQAGYNFTSGAITEELEQFYFHYDNTGSTEYITDYAGLPRQYAVFLPSGERWIYQTNTGDNSPFMYKAMQYDEETEMYDLGNIYYDPVTNVEQSIDPVLQNFGESTFLERPEGDFYYDYAEDARDDSDPVFDNEILNSEKPDPFLSNASTDATDPNDDQAKPLTYEMVKDALKGKELGWDAESIDIDKSLPYAKEIKELAPHLITRNDVNFENKKEFKKFVKNALTTPKRKQQIKDFKRFFRRKIMRKKERKVRF